ncbi:MAG: acyl-CoA dehydrogenase family protein [Thermoleophilia bacterium]|nr:acyl-CoA dehydrogenase family protein [Thermoleophilia bacterium]
MEFTLSNEQRAIATMVRDLMEGEIKPRVDEIEEAGVFPVFVRELFQRYELFAAMLPAEFGGIDGSLQTQCVVAEEVARVCGVSSMVVTNQSLGSSPIVSAGNKEQKEKWLPSFASGEKLVSFGLTEPNAGSDVRGLSSRAVRADGGWRINGRKCFVTHANVADLVVVFAKVKENGDRITAFLVETDREGFEVDKVEHKMGLKGSPTCSFVLEDVWVPEENILGKIGDGFQILIGSLNKGRISVAAQANGLARGAMEASLRYARDRVQFGQPLAKMPVVQQIIADMATAIEASRCLTWAAAHEYDSHSSDMVRYSGMAKLFATETAMKVTTDAVQIMGGYGYMVDYGVERMMRDAKVFQIIEGSNQIQRLSIAREALASL